MVEKILKIILDNSSVVTGLKKQNKELEETNEQIEDTQENTDKMGSSFLSAAKDFKFMGISINSVSKSLKILKANLIATGIGAIVVAVGTLASAFLSTEEGMDKVNKILKPLTTTLETAWGILQEMGNGLAMIFSGDVAAGWARMSDAVEDVGEKMEEAWKRGQELYDLQMKIRGLDQVEDLTVARLQKQIALNKLIAEDRSKSFEERMAATNQIITNEKAIAAIRKQTLDARITAMQKEHENNETTSADQKELNGLLAEQTRLETEAILKGKEAFVKRQTLQQEYLASIPESPRDMPLPALGGMTINEYDMQLTEIEGMTAISADEMVKTNKARNEKMAADERQREEDELNRKKAVGDASIGIAQSVTSIIGMIAEEGSAAAKAAAVAQATINTYQGVTAALSAVVPYPEPFASVYRFASAAAVGVAGFMNVKNILSVDPKNGSGGRGGGSAPSAPSVPRQPSFNLVQGTGTNQIQETIDAQNNTPAKSYVVSSDMTSEQALDRNIKETASL